MKTNHLPHLTTPTPQEYTLHMTGDKPMILLIPELAEKIYNSIPREEFILGDIPYDSLKKIVKAYHAEHGISQSHGFISSVIGAIRSIHEGRNSNAKN
jgi:hypothetical protein